MKTVGFLGPFSSSLLSKEKQLFTVSEHFLFFSFYSFALLFSLSMHGTKKAFGTPLLYLSPIEIVFLDHLRVGEHEQDGERGGDERSWVTSPRAGVDGSDTKL